MPNAKPIKMPKLEETKKLMGKSATAPGKPATPGKAFGQSMKGVGRQGKGKGMIHRRAK